MKNTVDILTKLGLSPREAVVYVHLIRVARPQGIADIARQTGLHRPAVYRAIAALSANKLVQAIYYGKRKKYEALSPAALQERAEKQQKETNALLTELEEWFRESVAMPTLRFLSGTDGYRMLFDDIAQTLKRGERFYRYSARRIDEKHFRISPQYAHARKHKHLERWVITSPAKAKEKRPRLDRWIRVIPEQETLFDDNVSQFIYADRVAFVDHETHHTIIITSKPIATFQRKLFLLLWNYLQEYTPKPEQT